MIVRDYKHWVGGYHTRRTGRTHVVRDTADFAAAVLLLHQEQDYDKAFRALERICELQDVREGSATFGLWSYYLEEDLEQMMAPDYNWSDFIGKNLIDVAFSCQEFLPDGLFEKLKIAIRNAMKCSIQRNVACDYTNMSIMGSMTIAAAGELLDDEEFRQIGSNRLEMLYKYTVFNGAFSEYNSSAYVLVAMNEIMRMLKYFRNPRNLFIAKELNRFAWEGLAKHYNMAIGQLTPPQARAYRDVDNGSLAWAIWQGTGGRYGRIPSREETANGGVSLESLYFPPSCPKECLPYFAEKESFQVQTYYRKNNLRQEDVDTTIIRELDSPDLTAYSYRTPSYSMGAFALCDCWNQRRNVMVLWDKEHPKYFRLRCINGDYDFCSGMVYAAQEKNRILGQLGLVTDRGSFHYILDKEKTGIYETDALYYKFELGGETDTLRICEENGAYVIRDDHMKITLHVVAWIFDGKQGSIELAQDGKAVILKGYIGEKKRLDTTKLGDTWGTFTLTVEDDRNGADAKDRAGNASEEKQMNRTSGKEKRDSVSGVRIKRLGDGRIASDWKGLQVTSFACPVPYRRALGLDGMDYAGIESRISVILEKMKNMEADGTVEESCPISIISMDAWEWPQGVALFAMYQYYKESGDVSVLEYLKNWFDRQLEKGLPPQNINTTCPMLTLACIYEETGDKAYLPVLRKWLRGVMEELPRTPEGGLQHVVSGVLNEGQLWDDTLYMTVLFLARMGRVLGEETYLQESIRQFMIHIKYLSDVSTGLFFHGWTFHGRHHFAKALWGRGNSWYTAGLVDYLECLTGNEGVKEFLITTLQQQAAALEDCQDESGLWHTLLDDRDSYLETSATCAFAYGILKAARMGYLPARYFAVGEKAVKGVLEQIAEDGTVRGVSYGTPVFATLQEYRDVPLCPMPYGQSMALMMLVEASRTKNVEQK